MSEYRSMNILNYIDASGEDTVRQILSTFSCSKNHEMENFVRNNMCGPVHGSLCEERS